ncbi:MAG: hypothetical protein U0234_14990 [Sandaracinus sp.]
MRSCRWLARLGISFLAWALIATTASAQASTADDEEARRLFRIGQAHYDHGDFREAATEFESAYALSHRPELLFNVYVAARDAGDLVRAREALRGYLDALPDADGAAALRSRLAVLDAQASGAADDGGETASEETVASPPTPHDAAAASSGSSGGISFGRSPVGWIVGGVGAAAVVAAIVTGVLALQQQGALEGRCSPDGTCPAGFEQDRDLGNTLAVTTDVLGAVGAVGLAVGVTLLFVLEPGGPELRAECSGQGCVGRLSVSF